MLTTNHILRSIRSTGARSLLIVRSSMLSAMAFLYYTTNNNEDCVPWQRGLHGIGIFISVWIAISLAKLGGGRGPK